jgi:hypothetical protein
MRLAAATVAASLLIACGNDDRPTPSADTAAEDTSPDAQSPDAVADLTEPPDGAGPDTEPADVPVDTAPDPDADIGGDAGDASEETWFANCGSLFAVRIAELQQGLDATFPLSCDAPLRADIGRLRQGGDALCNAGESPNACRDRLYATPPAMGTLDQGCAEGGPTDGCLLGSFLARCADGTDDCADDEVVCWDGMRPMIYAEAATAGPSPSDVWWFHMGGEGGPCSGAMCWATYRLGENEFKFAMSSLHPENPSNAATRGSGVTSGDPTTPYARVNRVRFERCTDAATDRVEEVPVSNGVPPEFAAQYPGIPVADRYATTRVWHKGLATWKAAFRKMAATDGRDLDGDATPDLPSLANARLVVLSASSDASVWLTLAADRLADELRAIAGPDVDVRIAIDGLFPPMLDNEARYHPDAPENFDMLSMPYADTGLCQLDDNGDGLDNEACSDQTFQAGGALRTNYEERGVLLDASCEAMHGVGAAECFDRNHTLVHHVGVPIFVLADQEDNTVSDSGPQYAHDRGWLFTTIDLYRKRIVDAGWDIVDFWNTTAREEGAGGAEGFMLVLPKARRNDQPRGRATHVRFGNDDRMADTMTLCSDAGVKVTTVSFSQMIAGWLTGELPQTFAIEDARRTLPNGSHWVTGSACRAAE